MASHSQTLTNLQPATTYQFRVRSKDEGGSSVVSSNFTFTTKSPADTTPPNDVTGFTATPSSGRVSLNWTNPTDADFKGVMLRYRTDGTLPNEQDGWCSGGGPNRCHWSDRLLRSPEPYQRSHLLLLSVHLRHRAELFQHGTHSGDTHQSLDLIVIAQSGIRWRPCCDQRYRF